MMYKNRKELEDIIEEKQTKKIPTFNMDWGVEFEYHKKYQQFLDNVDNGFKSTSLLPTVYSKDHDYANNVIIQQPKRIHEIPSIKVILVGTNKVVH